jgi:ubiquinone/menaquinone biosynthesis C-methylase UbiE
MDSGHRSRIIDQFTRQAAPFAQAPANTNQEALDFIVRACGAGPQDSVLDVACGPGLLVCAFARVAGHAAGIDLTPAMLEQARKAQQERGLSNVSWQQGDVTALPYPDAHFSIVSSRFVFHHLEDPLIVLKEMKRVCKPGGRVVVADMAPPPAKAAALNAMERLRDPSHVRALTEAELISLFSAAGLGSSSAAGLVRPRVEHYRMEDDLENLLSRSFPKEGDADRIRQLFAGSIATDALGLATRRENGKIFYSFPLAVLVGEKK